MTPIFTKNQKRALFLTLLLGLIHPLIGCGGSAPADAPDQPEATHEASATKTDAQQLGDLKQELDSLAPVVIPTIVVNSLVSL